MSTVTLTRPLRAVRYSRVSEDRTGEIRSVARQEIACENVIKANGWSEVGIFTDGEVSASRFSTKTRDGWTALLAALAAGTFDILVLWESSRGDRKADEWLGMLKTCRTMGVRIFVTSEDTLYDLRKPGDWRSLASQGIDAEVESWKISKRVTGAMEDAAQRGRPHSRCPYGMRRIYDTETGLYVDQVADPETIEIVREIIGRIAKGEPVSKITNDLNARGIPSPKGGTWIRTAVKWVARNRALIGLRTNPAHRRDASASEYLPGSWAPVIDVELFYAATNLLESRSNLITISRPGAQKYLLSYLVTCSVCGSQLGGKNRGVKYGVSYGCTGSDGCVSVKREWLDEFVTEATFARILSASTTAMLNENTAAADAFATVAQLRAEVAALIDDCASGEVDPRIGTKRITRLEQDIAAAEEVARATVPVGVRTLTEAQDIRASWAMMTVPEQREILRAVWSAMTLDPVPAGSVRGGMRTGVEPERVHLIPA